MSNEENNKSCEALAKQEAVTGGRTPARLVIKRLRAGDIMVSDGVEYEVKRVHGPTRKDWNHTTVYFKGGRATTMNSNTLIEVRLAGKRLIQLQEEGKL